MVECVLRIIALVVFCLYFTFPDSSFGLDPDSSLDANTCSSSSVFYTLDQINKGPYPFCEGIYKEIPILDFRIVPFYLQSFFDPKLFLMHPTKGLKLVPKNKTSISTDFQTVMSNGIKSGRDDLNLSDYGVKLYGMHRSGMDSLCIYYNSRGQCVKQCLPIPALRRPVLRANDKEEIVAEFKVRSVIEGNLKSATSRDYKEKIEEMSLEGLQAIFGKSVGLILPKIDVKNHEFETIDGCTEKDENEKCIKSKKEIATSIYVDNIKCLGGLNYAENGYYVKRYDKSIGGHRYFWLRSNKKKFVRHIYSNGIYYPCDDSMSYDLDNISMKSFVTSIKGHDTHYTIPKVKYNLMPYSGDKKSNLCKNSELYFYIPTYLRRIKDEKECIFGELKYSSDEKEHTKSCLYSYTSDDFETFGAYKNKSELKNLDFFLQNDGVLSGLVERNLYFEGMCIDKFPKYEYKVKKHVDGTVTKQYVYEIGNYHKCDFIKIEAWGGGQAGYVNSGTAYSGTPAYYTLGILKNDNNKLNGKKLVIYVGEGGKYPREYGEDTVVALCNSDNFDNSCQISLVARGCTHNKCRDNSSFINDDTVVHYRSATGMDFNQQRPLWLQHYRLIPWGNSNFPEGIVRLNVNDCNGPLNAFEKSPNQYPGSGGCAKLGKSIQQGADGLVRLTCEMWSSGSKVQIQDMSYTYNKSKKSLCSVNSDSGCLKSICIYSSNDETMKFSTPITMFGEEECKPIVSNIPNLFVNLSKAGDKMTVSRAHNGYCYNNHKKDLRLIYGSNVDNALYENNLRINYKKCWQDNEHHDIGLSCYRNRASDLKVPNDKYICCYYDMKDTSHHKDICWKTNGADLLKKFSYSTLPLALREKFDNGSKELLTKLPPSNTIKPFADRPDVITDIKYDYSKEKTSFCLNTKDGIKKGCLQTVCVYEKGENDVFASGTYLITRKGVQCPSKNEMRVEDSEISENINLSCKSDGKCCYSSDNKKAEKLCWANEEVSLLCYEDDDTKDSVKDNIKGGKSESDGVYKCCYGKLEDYKSPSKNDKKRICWKKSLTDLTNMLVGDDAVELAKLNTKEIKGKTQYRSSQVKMIEGKLVELEYIYDQEKKTFCLDTTDTLQNRGCLASLCIYAKDGTLNSQSSSYPTSLCITQSAMNTGRSATKMGKIGQSVKMSCTNEHCCYGNGNGERMCMTDEKLVLSCYETGNISEKGEFDYTCCYTNTDKTSENVCWKVSDTIWQILGYYRLSEKVREQINEHYNKPTIRVVKGESGKPKV
ncbi:hypothetical protein Ecaj_0835 [Ehrlichia canis str. Jake]|uniref:Uncharacterized protein n=1 Tax=Ehrlichia canis (strain Jake) TaxID=269484 RepID=A0ACA6AWI8_EHRCJ|nr:hypothetical protein Ecaj_0835 [Ehrlichia canis str. Jake]